VRAASAASASRAEVVGTANPIAKVTTLLKDMQNQLSKEAEDDEAIHEKTMCWCGKTDPMWEKSIDDKEAYIVDLTTLIESTAAGSARLKQEIINHEQDLTKSQQSLDTATALRDKQAAEFNGEEKDMLQSIQALGSAIVVLSKHYKGAEEATSLVDRTRAIQDAASVARAEMQRHRTLLQGSMTPRQRRVVLSLGAEKNAYLQQTSTLRQNYAPQSGEIFGILKQMKETFETNLKESQKEETDSQKAFEDLKGAKMEEISATKGAFEEKQVQLAESDEKNAQAKLDLENTSAMVQDENGLLTTVKQKCTESNAEYERRSSLRREEITAVAQAIATLTSDEARDQFSKSFAPASLLQVSGSDDTLRRSRSRSRSRREAAVRLLQSAATRARQTPQRAAGRLAALAISSKIDAFTKVKEAIDKMVTELQQEKADEIKHRDSCISELHENEMFTEREERSKADSQSKADGLEMTIKDLGSEVDVLNSEIAELQLQIKRNGEDREIQNKEFQQTVADHRESQKLLQKALSVLKVVYAKAAEPAPALLQAAARTGGRQLREHQPTTGVVEAPEGFSKYARSGASSGVVALIEQIIADTLSMEKEVVKDEQALQETYESFVKESNLSISSKQQAIVDKTEDKAKADQQLNNVKQDIKSSVTQLEQLSNTAGALHMSCDFIMKNFDLRQEARDQEIEALQQAKAVLSGMQLP